MRKSSKTTDHPTTFPNNFMTIEQNGVKLKWRSELTLGVICCITPMLICSKHTFFGEIKSHNSRTIKVKIFFIKNKQYIAGP